MDGGVDEPGGVVEEEGFGFVGVEEGEGVLVVLVEGVAVFVEAEGVVRVGGGEAGEAVGHGGSRAPVGGGELEADVFGLGKGIVIDGDVPFSTVAGGVAVSGEGFGDGEFIGGHASAIPGVHHAGVLAVGCGRRSANDVGLLGTCGVVSADNGAAGGGAGGGGRVGLPEHHALFGEGVDVGSLVGGGGVDVIAFDVLPAEIVGEDKDDVGLGGPICGK